MYSTSVKKVRFIARRMKPLGLVGSLSGIAAALYTGCEGIAELKDDTGRVWAVSEVLAHLDAGVTAFVVGSSSWREAYVQAKGFGLHRWVQTEGDGAPDNNLLSLPLF